MKKLPSFVFVYPALIGACLLRASPLFAAPNLLESPAHASLTALGTIATQRFTNPQDVQGGVVVEVDGAGNYYHATGSMIAKYNPGGTLQWSQFQTPHSINVGTVELEQFRYYDRWEDDHGGVVDIQLASGNDKGELAQPYAQKIAIDSSGDVYVSFLDLWHRNRSILAKFDGETGVVEWVARTSLPHETDSSARYFTKVIDLLVLPDQSVAVLESGMGEGRFAFTRLVIFASAGASQNGVPAVTYARVRRDDLGTNYRMSIGVGMVVAPDGSLIYGTFEGSSLPNLPVYPNPFPVPDKLVLRKLAAPYTGTPVEVVHDAAEVSVWSDLAIGPGGTIYALGTVRITSQRKHAILAGFNPGTFAETLLPRKTYPTPTFLPTWELPGIELLPTGTDTNDALYITTGLKDFRHEPYLNSVMSYTPVGLYLVNLAVTKVNASGTILWQKHEYNQAVYDAFTDGSDNLYLLGHNFEASGVGIYKYSPSGRLQIGHNVSSDNGRAVNGRFTGTINASGNIVVAFPQLFPSGDPLFGWFNSPLVLFSNPANIENTSTIDFPEFLSSAYPGEVLTLSATASNGQPVSFEVTVGGNIAYVTGNSLVLQSPGLVSVRALQFNGGNFTYSEVRSLAVYKRPQTITFRAPGSQKFKKNGKFTLSASSTSDLPVTFTSSDSKIVKIAGNTATIRKKGKATITAFQPGDDIYLSATAVKQIVKVK